jgi:hypothetical protein
MSHNVHRWQRGHQYEEVFLNGTRKQTKIPVCVEPAFCSFILGWMMDGWMDGWMSGWMDDGWMDG